MSNHALAASHVTLDELAALNVEIAALVRAGVPLERGLGHLGRDLPGRLGRLSTELSERCAQGRSLAQVLADDSMAWPPVYRAVVEAGVRTGRLPAALESLATSLRRLDEARRNVMAAAVYPLIVVMLACVLLALFTASVAPRMAAMMVEFEVPGAGAVGWAASLGPTAAYWGAAVPAALVLLAAVWWLFARRASLVEAGSSTRPLGWLPWAGALTRCSRAAAMAELLALLVENEVPLPEALPLAAEATGDPRLAATARGMAEWIARGQAGPPPAPPGRRGLPPLVQWPIVTGQPRGPLLAALRRAAETYRRRAEWQAGALRVYLPVLLTVGIGGAVTVGYALTVFGPYAAILRSLGQLQ